MFGAWHNINLKPDLQACVLEKVGTKHWKKLAKKQYESRNLTFQKSYNLIQLENTQNYNRSVFLRDPLERFLSGFLDKCNAQRRNGDAAHCEPQSIFGPARDSPMDDFYHTRRKLFEAYVDSFPIKWNVHFAPQALMCDGGLYRHIDHFDFVGHMDSNFYSDVARFGDRYDLRPGVDDVFGLAPELPHEGQRNNTGVETSASTHVREYYSPATVRRVLELESIDYVLLNLTIPRWAQEMLLQESESVEQEELEQRME